MDDWRSALHYDPIPALLAAESPSLRYLVRRDLLGKDVGAPSCLWETREVQRLLATQAENGSWPYPGGGRPQLRSVEDYAQIETFRCVGLLVEKHAMDRRHPAIERAADFLFSRQTAEGDFRGIYGNQYTPNYSSAIMELLTKAGYADDERIVRGFGWLASVRQSDGGWAIPLTTIRARWDVPTLGGSTLQPDRSTPFSHMVTGVVLRAFAAHPTHRHSADAVTAAHMVASRFFRQDTYPGRDAPKFWESLCFPFWFTDIVSALDSLSIIGLGRDLPEIHEALDWLVGRQAPDGIWNAHILRSGKAAQAGLWVGLAICRVFQRLAG
jgi:hypothetical protein